MVAVAEGTKVEGGGGAGRPGAQGVDAVVLVANHGHIIGDGFDGVGILGFEYLAAIQFLFLHVAAKLDLAGIFGNGDLPHVAVAGPVVRHFHLLTVDQFLAEQAVLIADGAAHGRQLLGSKTVHEAGSQTAKAAVAQRGFRLFGQDLQKIHTQLSQRFFIYFFAGQVNQVAVHQPTQKILDGEIIHALAPGFVTGMAGDHPLLHHLVSDSHSDSLVQLLLAGFGDGNAVVPLQLAHNTPLDGFFIESSGWHSGSSLHGFTS